MAGRVIAGDYLNLAVDQVGGGKPYIILKAFKTLILDKSNIESLELINSEDSKSVVSGVVRGAIGAALLGPVGLVAGGLSAKNKGNYLLAVKFKDGKSSLMDVDSKVYKSFVKVMF